MPLFDHPIRAILERLDDGLNITLFGGGKSHIGCVATAEADGALQLIDFPGHKEQGVCTQWVTLLAKQSGLRTAMTCGIHYDNLTKEQLSRVIDALESLLQQILHDILESDRH